VKDGRHRLQRAGGRCFLSHFSVEVVGALRGAKACAISIGWHAAALHSCGAAATSASFHAACTPSCYIIGSVHRGISMAASRSAAENMAAGKKASQRKAWHRVGQLALNNMAATK